MTKSNTKIPSYLSAPPTSKIEPPVDTKAQKLPFGELSWEDFEKLCLRLAKLESQVEHCQLYGEKGNEQKGIDIFARKQMSKKYSVYQCKRVKDFGPSKIKDAVAKFLKGDWIEKTDTFILCTQESLISKLRADEVEKQNKILNKKSVSLVPWDKNELSVKLKEYPKLVYDFFGKTWVEKFCGPEEAKELRNRLEKKDVIEYRKKLGTFYRELSNKNDLAISITNSIDAPELSIEDRFVLPDIYEKRSIGSFLMSSVEQSEERKASDLRMSMLPEEVPIKHGAQLIRKKSKIAQYRQRVSIEKWLASNQKNIILGEPGSGKSSFLRFLATDILSDSPNLRLLSNKWGDFLPIWIPFAFLTREVSNPDRTDDSLLELIERWLNSWTEGRLLELVKKALADERLLLLVDGLDEWVNESTAQLVLDRLQIFIDQRPGIRAVFTSRPHGFSHLNIQRADWHIGELCEFSKEQQRQLAQIWFMHKIRCLAPTSDIDESELARKCDYETDKFTSELKKSTDLQELTKTPFLLSLLIYLKFQNASLPQNRFSAYDELINHLLIKHPNTRKTAAALVENKGDLSDEDLKMTMAYLAHFIHSEAIEGVINKKNALTSIEEFLRGDNGLGIERLEARRLSREIIDIDDNAVGCVVKKSQQDIGFFHRAFQEYLTSDHLSRLSLREQLDVIQKFCTDPQWREVILGLFFLNKRSMEVQQYIECIKAKKVNSFEEYSRDLLLAEIAFGNFNCPPNLSKSLSKEVFGKIETESWMPQREQLLKHVLNGLRTAKVKEIVKSKLKEWFPDRIGFYTSYVFKEMAKWPSSPELIECLFRGFYSEDEEFKRAAAKALAEVAKDDLAVGAKVAEMAKFAIDPLVRVASLEALIQGWSAHEKVDKFLSESRQSNVQELRLVAIKGLIQRDKHTDEDMQELFRLGNNTDGVGFRWRDDVAMALLDGWPKSSEVKSECLKAARIKRYEEGLIEKEIAIHVLFEGFSQDKDVVEFCVRQIKTEAIPFLGFSGIENWRLLSKNFKDQPQLVEAIDEWILKQEYHEMEVTYAAQVGRTEVAKSHLLTSIKKRFSHWPAHALLDGWGIEDDEVKEKLLNLVDGPAMEASWIGHLLPQIIKDKSACRQRLLEILRSSECERVSFVLEGLKTLEEKKNDPEVVDIILEKISKDEINDLDKSSIKGQLISIYPENERVKKLAKDLLLSRESDFVALASAYGADDEIRSIIMKAINPLPSNLRSIIAENLGEGIADDDFVLAILRDYDCEENDAVKVSASISYYSHIKETRQNPKDALQNLEQAIIAVGSDFLERRQAAFCGLGLLDRLDIMQKHDNERMCAISLRERISPNLPLIKFVLQNWDAIKNTFENEFISRINNGYIESFEFWNQLYPVADEYPSARDDALSFIEMHSNINPSSIMLQFLGRVKPKSEMILKLCLKSIQNENMLQESVVAAELLGTHFAGDIEIKKKILGKELKFPLNGGAIIALCIGWPDCKELDEFYDYAKENKIGLIYPAFFHLFCTKSDKPDRIYDAFIDFLGNKKSWIMGQVTRPLIERLKKDEVFYRLVVTKLHNKPNSTEKATFPKMLVTSRGLSAEVRKWCISEIETQLSKSKSPETGYDLFVGELRPVVHCLMETLS